ncbi:response regulator PleD [compost metagenome]
MVAQLMLDRLNGQNIVHESSPFGHVTVSIGLSSMPGANLDQWQSLLDKADQALYIAKAAGRNRLAVG